MIHVTDNAVMTKNGNGNDRFIKSSFVSIC